MKSKANRILGYFLILLASFIFSLTLYIKYKFGDAKAEQLFYSLFHAEGTSNNVITDAAIFILPIVIISLLLFIFLTTTKIKKQTYLKIIIKNKIFNLKLFPIKHYLLLSNTIFIISILICSFSIDLFSYIKNIIDDSPFIEEHYVNPNSVKLTFPKQKQNLIYIYVESLESTYESTTIDSQTFNLIPKLKMLAEENINFSHDDDFGGINNIYGTDWTIAATVAQTAGIPLKLIIDLNGYTGYSSFLPGVIGLGDILEKEGYNQYYMIGSLASFGGRESYFQNHGKYEILDLTWAKKENKIAENYNVNWGFEDSKLFEYSKEKLLEISKTNEPFNFTILTSDTHTPNGLTEPNCKKDYNYKYANAILCSDNMIFDFIKWLQKQSFYKNTTIIIVGDHLTMQGDINSYVDENSRYIYNTIINSKIPATNSKNRAATSFDLFPTTLASMGVQIEGDKLGLGTNLFSDKPTLLEELGTYQLNSNLIKKSSFYNNYFLQDNYYEMLKSVEEGE